MYIQIKSKFLNTIILLFPIVFASAMIWLRINHYSTYEIIGREDHIIEYSQFFFFLFGGIVALVIACKFKKICKLMFFLFLFIAFGLIIVAGEEISWGERIFNIESHEIFDGETKIPVLKYNVQGEMNLHNFKPIHNIVGYLYLIVGSYFIFSWIFAKTFLKSKKILKPYLPFLIPPPLLSLYFLPVAINLFNRQRFGFPPQDYEMVEFLFSLGILIFLLLCYQYLKKDFKVPQEKS